MNESDGGIELQLFFTKKKTNFSDVWYRFRRNKLAVIGLIVITLFILVAIFANYLMPYDPYKIDIRNRLKGPSKEHWLGTDDLGRDVLSRLILGTRVSLRVGLIVVGISATVGTIIGLLSGYAGGWVDNLVMRIVDILLAFPGILLALAIVAILGPGIDHVILALTLTGWVGYARVVRGEVLTIKEEEYITAAKSSGIKKSVILFKYILPNALSPIIVLATFGIAGAIIAESSLSFLGLGVKPPEPSWGSLLNVGRRYIMVAPYLSIFPGIFIMVVVMALNFIGDGLRDALDPRLRNK
ncbi:MAG TPA: ABC transporter permease [Thermotogaceae bacterium]|nr:ABC transporter permease [Thermotogota bacterium]HEW92363.1 ABC transporter permease [Thermotogaceae bacterium]